MNEGRNNYIFRAYLGIKCCSFFLLLLFSNLVCSQTLTERRIYYLDVTASMQGFNGNPNIWDEVRNNLIDAINAIKDETTELVVVTFTDARHPLALLGNKIFRATASDKEQIKKEIQKLSTRKDFTDIYITFENFYKEYIGEADVTYFFVMTDGLQSPKFGGTIKLEQAIDNWEKVTQACGKQTYGFYVMLTNAAQSSDQTLEKLHSNLWKVKSADVNINMIRLENAVCNIHERQYVDVPCSGDIDKCGLKLIGNSNHYKVGRIEKINDSFRVQVERNDSSSPLPLEESMKVDISLENKTDLDFLLTESITIKCLYRGSMEIRPTFNKAEKSIEKLGKVTYYPKFLWLKEKDEVLTDTLFINFNDYAKRQNGCCEFEFTDKKGNVIPKNELEITVNGNVIENNRVKVTSSTESIEVQFHYLPKARKGEHKGVLKLTENHNLDKDGEVVLQKGQTNNSLVWQIKYDKRMNPLAKSFMWIGFFILACFLLWFLVIRPLKYPLFKNFKKAIIVYQNNQVVYNRNVQFKRARLVILSNRKEKQSALNRILTGRVKTIVSPIFTNKVVFVPKKNGKVAFVRAIGFMVTPNPIPRNGIATITNNQMEIRLN